MDLKRLMFGVLSAAEAWTGMATAGVPGVGSQGGNPNLKPSLVCDGLTDAAAVMAMAAVGKGNPEMLIEIVEFEIT